MNGNHAEQQALAQTVACEKCAALAQREKELRDEFEALQVAIKQRREKRQEMEAQLRDIRRRKLMPLARRVAPDRFWFTDEELQSLITAKPPSERRAKVDLCENDHDQ